MILDGSSSSFTVHLTDMTEEIYPNFHQIKWTLLRGKCKVVLMYSTQQYPGIFFNTKSAGAHSMRKAEDCHSLLHQKKVHSLTAGKLENVHSFFLLKNKEMLISFHTVIILLLEKNNK
jgi:hypothetical protein